MAMPPVKSDKGSKEAPIRGAILDRSIQKHSYGRYYWTHYSERLAAWQFICWADTSDMDKNYLETSFAHKINKEKEDANNEGGFE